MSYNYTNTSSSDWGGTIIAGVIILIIIGFFVAVSANGSSSSSGSSSRLDYDPTDYYDSAYDYTESDYDYYIPEPDYDDYYDDYIEESNIETWNCIDATSYDKNPYNDNYCVSSYGREMYTTDSYAESLDPYYTAGTSGHPYYNSF